MCTGKFVRYFCPVAIAKDPLCKYFDPATCRIRSYSQLWVRSKFVCCGQHRGSCVKCPVLYHPGNIEYQQSGTLNCLGCGARLYKERAAAEGHTELEGSVASYWSDSYTGTSVYAEMMEAKIEKEVEKDVDGFMEVEKEVEKQVDGCVEVKKDAEEEVDGFVEVEKEVEEVEGFVEVNVEIDGAMDVKWEIVCNCKDCMA